MNARLIPNTQRAVQLTGPDCLRLNKEKPVPRPGPYQVLARIELTGLCFSDLKLLKQFNAHPRKSDVIAHLDANTLAEVPSYVPNDQPTIPGHETVVRIVETGDQVSGIQPGERYLVQTDYRWLKTAQSNAAFGYNFEGALQEFVLLDQRVITSPDGDSMLIPASDHLAASSVALVEPWACVEDSYVVQERRAPLPNRRSTTIHSSRTTLSEVRALPDESLDDILFLGANPDLLEAVFPKLAAGGLINIVQQEQRFGRDVQTPVGRIHYGGIRITGTPDCITDDGYAAIPRRCDISVGDTINVIGAAGPMGTMHVIRNLCQGVLGITLYAGDMSEARLSQLAKLAQPLADSHNLKFIPYQAGENAPDGPFNYIALMVPAAALVEQAVQQAALRAVINIFAGIPAEVTHPIDLDTYIEKQAYFIGTSGSTIEDMKIVLRKVTEETLDTNLSVAAISGLEGAVDGIRAVESQAIPGKIIVYPTCRGLPLTRLEELAEKLPVVGEKLVNGVWTREAEAELLRTFNHED